MQAERGVPEAERRQLTVMFCDLVGSTLLSERLDPEELREVILAYQEVCAQIIRRFEGHLARYIGDGLLVYFGYPQAHEDDAQRAVRAGLEIVAALPQLNARLQQTLRVLQQLPLQIRIGIHTGLVVVSDMGGGGYHDPMAIVGETPNIASRLQGIAEPDTVVISATTFRLVTGLFECRSLGPQMLKGISAPIAVYYALGESSVQSRFEVALRKGLTPLVGREQEVGLLLARWERVKEGTGQAVLLNGEAGIGKSRLVQVLKEQVGKEPHSWLECRCSPYHQHSAFYPVIELLQRVLQFRWEDSPEEKLRKLEGALESRSTYGTDSLSRQEVVPLFASLLSLSIPDRYPPLKLTPQSQKRKTQEALLAWLLAEAERQSVFLVLEDLHWADPSTLELVGFLIAQGPMARILTLLTCRPDFNSPWPLRSHLDQVTLGRLTRKQVEMMVEKIAGDEALPVEVVQQVVTKTDGVPLFVEELTKTVLESGFLRKGDGGGGEGQGITSLLPPTIPATLHDSLMARLDRLSTGKEVAQLGATVGREFSYELLRAVSSLDEDTLRGDLSRLVDAELLYQRGVLPQARYLFKHALIRDAAYQSLLRSKRQQYHQRIAQVLSTQFPETAETQPELLAHHYTEARLTGDALLYWQKAGERAIRRSANIEAINHLTKGLELLKTLPDAPHRTLQELQLQITLGAPLVMTRGYAAPEVERVYTRARELCRQAGEIPQLFPVLVGLWVFYLVRAELQKAHELAEELLSLAEGVGDPALLLEAHNTLGHTQFYLGEFVSARAHLEQCLALYDPERHSSLALVYIHDPGVFALDTLAWVLWHIGYADQAITKNHEAALLAHKLAHPFSVAHTLFNAAVLHQLRGEEQAAQERAEEDIAVCTEQEFLFWAATGTALRGWALAEQGRGEEGIAQIHQGMALYRGTGSELGRPYLLALLAEAYGKAGRAQDGLLMIAEALTIISKNNERHYEAELYRLKGDLALRSTAQGGVRKEAEECFRKAIEIARTQSAKAWELRAAMSLSRLLQSQGRRGEARQILANIYSLFTEGFETKDLKEAKMLLAEAG